MKRFYFPNTVIHTSEHGYENDLEITTSGAVYARMSGELRTCDNLVMRYSIRIVAPDQAKFTLIYRRFAKRPRWILKILDSGIEIALRRAA